MQEKCSKYPGDLDFDCKRTAAFLKHEANIVTAYLPKGVPLAFNKNVGMHFKDAVC